MKILFLEDDDAIGMGLKYSLEKEGYEVTHTCSLSEAKTKWTPGNFDLAIIDINLPDGNGYDLCKLIKSSEDIPVIFLTAADAEVNVVMGLEMGADDYICKPFRINELMARIRTVLRRSVKAKDTAAASVSDGLIHAGNVVIDTNSARVTMSGDEPGAETVLDLTALEYRLLLAFCNNRGTVLSRDILLQELWDVDGDFVNDNTLTVYIKRLRDKIEKDPSDPHIIKTVRGLGYIMDK